MLLKIDSREYPVVINEYGHVCVSVLNYRTWTLKELLEILRQDFGKVELPPNAFTDDPSTLEECVRYGFKSVDERMITIDGRRVALRPGGYLNLRKRKVAPNPDGSDLRFYWATFLEKGRESWRQIFTESDLVKRGISP